MKNVMKFGLVMAMLFGMAFSAFANVTDFSLRVANATGKTVSLSLIDAKDITLSIYDKNDEVLYRETIASNGPLSKKYDLSAFPAGNYTLEAESATSVTRYDISVDANSATISENAKAEVKKPMLVKKDQHNVSLSIINVEKTPVEIAIFDENGVELYRNTFPAEVSVVKMFNFNGVGHGNYTFVTRYSNKTFTDAVEAGI